VGFVDFTLIENYIDGLLDEPSPDKPVWNVERAKSGAKPHWNYIDGCFLLALWTLYEKTRDERYAKFCDAFMDFYIDGDGTPLGYTQTDYNLDNICAGRVLFDLIEYSPREKYVSAIKLLFNQLKRQPRTYEGSFWHKAIYPNQVWLDGLYMAQPFLIRYAIKNNRDDLLADSFRQFKTIGKRAHDPATGLYRHGYDASKSIFWADKYSGQSLNPWLRALGWYAMALTDCVSFLPQTQSGFRDTLAKTLSGLLISVEKYADPATGMYYQVPDRDSADGNYLEASGSSMIALAMMKSARMGLIDARFGQAGFNTFKGVCDTYLRKDDKAGASGLSLGGICLSAGLGPSGNTRRDGSFEYYISEPVVANDAKGVAPFLMCYAEAFDRH
jgi:unsaturated rhamnogalacturonyl hydrolase